MPVHQVAQMLERGGGEAFGLVDDQQFDELLAGTPACGWVTLWVEVLFDAAIDPADEQRQFLPQHPKRDADRRRVEHGARAIERGIDVKVGWITRPPCGQQGAGLVPACVASGRERFADARWTMAQADVAVPADGIGELGEAAMLLRRDEAGGARPAHGRHPSSW